MKNLKNLFSKPTVQSVAQDELYEAERKLMEAQTGLEYAHAMVDYHTNRVARLKKLLDNQPKTFAKVLSSKND